MPRETKVIVEGFYETMRNAQLFFFSSVLMQVLVVDFLAICQYCQLSEK